MEAAENNILYTTHCPRCKVLKSQLDAKNIPYTEFTDINKMMEDGMTSVPMLYADGKLMNMSQAIQWIRNQ